MRTRGAPRRHPSREAGQMIVVAALAMVAIVGGVALVLESGNAYANQRIAQNAADAVAHAGATVLAQRLGGTAKNDAEVAAWMQDIANDNDLASFTAYYVNVLGQYIAATGLVATSPGEWVQVGTVGSGMPPPPKAQGVRVTGVRTFGTTFGRVIGLGTLDASADATAVMGRLTGGNFMPAVLPVSPSDCSNSGFLQPFDDPSKSPMWYMSNPGTTHPDGTEYIVPLCKTGGGSFMFLDLDPTLTCAEEVLTPPAIQFAAFPTDVNVDIGADCAKKVGDAIDAAHLQGKVILIPVCDAACVTKSANNATYHVVRIAAFYLDFVSYVGNNPNDNTVQPCERTTSPTYGTPLVPFVSGNASDGCMAGWFVRYITAGPVGSLDVYNGEAIGVQLIR
jgi:hypothetical protein